MDFVNEVRTAFMTGATRHANWESFLESFTSGDFTTTDFETLRKAYMAGHTRHMNWEQFRHQEAL